MSYRTVAGILAFQLISFMILIPGGGASVFFDVNMTQEDLEISPDIPDPSPEAIDLEDTYTDENVTFVDTENYFNGSQDYNTSKSVVVEDNASSGSVIYNTPEAERVEIKTTTQEGILLCGTGVEVSFLDSGQNVLSSNTICGETGYNTPDNTQFIQFDLNDPDNSVLYELSTAENEEVGFLGTLFAQISAGLTFPLKLLSLFGQFPWYIQVFYGGMLAWMVADILQIG